MAPKHKRSAFNKEIHYRSTSVPEIYRTACGREIKHFVGIKRIGNADFGTRERAKVTCLSCKKSMQFIL
jgi:hypothetical protein